MSEQENTVTDQKAEQAPPAAPVKSILASAADDFDVVPEKLRVLGADGKIDQAASLRKVSEVYRNLEHRMGSGDAPPKDAEGYAPEITKDGFSWDEWKKDPKVQGFLKGAHAKGMTNAQVSYVLQEYLTEAQELMGASSERKIDTVEAELRERWKEDGEFHENLRLAMRAAKAYVDEGDQEGIDKGAFDHPAVIRLLANIGRAMKEDAPPSGAVAASVDFGVRVRELRAELEKLSPWDQRRPALLEEMNGLYAKQYPSQRA